MVWGPSPVEIRLRVILPPEYFGAVWLVYSDSVERGSPVFLCSKKLRSALSLGPTEKDVVVMCLPTALGDT